MLPLPLFYIPHGAGPCFYMDWTRGGPDTWKGIERWFRSLAAQLPAKPMAVLVITTHCVGSGFSLHNRSALSKAVLSDSESIDDWLSCVRLLADDECAAELAVRDVQPAARALHPGEEHLLQLRVVSGTVQGPRGHRALSEVVLGSLLSGHCFA